MAQYKLLYWDARGRAEHARLLFAYADVPYDDVRIDRKNWPEIKPSINLLKLSRLLYK